MDGVLGRRKKSYFDYAKAFDKVSHRLIVNLKAYGIGGKVLAWIEAWLTNRRQRVWIKSVCKVSTKTTASGPDPKSFYLSHFADADKSADSRRRPPKEH